MTLDIDIDAYVKKVNEYKNKTKAATEWGKDAANMDQYLAIRGKKIKKEFVLVSLDDKTVKQAHLKKKDPDLYAIFLSVQKAGQITQGCLSFGMTDLSFKYKLKKVGFKLSYEFKLMNL